MERRSEKRIRRPERQEQERGMEGAFYEMEFGAAPAEGKEPVRKAPEAEKIAAPQRDEIREQFERMRDIGRARRVMVFSGTSFRNLQRQHKERAETFYYQGMFMKEFRDDYRESVPCGEYYPCYQMMGYGQLRTYFTWRTRVREGRPEETSPAYVYLYFYELLNNIGVASPEEGLDRLLLFWEQTRGFEPSVDKYMPGWLKDYHIYYGIPQPFTEFVREHGFEEWYPEVWEGEREFERFCDLSGYDIRKSGFYGQDTEEMIRGCFAYLLERLRTAFREKGIEFESLFSIPAGAMAVWMPFRNALFYPWMRQGDRRVDMPGGEVYECVQGRWFYRKPIAAESGKRLATYLLKRMEAELRQAVGYRYRLTAGLGLLPDAVTRRLREAGIDLEQIVAGAVADFYRESRRTVVLVDREALERIRREAEQTQEKLLVPEEETQGSSGGSQEMQESNRESRETQESSGESREAQESNSSPWEMLGASLGREKREALRIALEEEDGIRREARLKEFADRQGIMLEVLTDGINEMGMDCMGDSLLDEEFAVFEDYREQVRQLLKEER